MPELKALQQSSCKDVKWKETTYNHTEGDRIPRIERSSDGLTYKMRSSGDETIDTRPAHEAEGRGSIPDSFEYHLTGWSLHPKIPYQEFETLACKSVIRELLCYCHRLCTIIRMDSVLPTEELKKATRKVESRNLQLNSFSLCCISNYWRSNRRRKFEGDPFHTVKPIQASLNTSRYHLPRCYLPGQVGRWSWSQTRCRLE